MCNLTLKKKNMLPLWLSNLLGSLGSALFGTALNYGSNRLNNMTLTGAQQEQNAWNAGQAAEQRAWSTSEREASQAFNSVEAEKNRAFQNQQAQNQMAFQRDMDSTVYQRRVADMQAAGINPALAIGGVSVGSTAGAAGAGSAASSSLGSGAAASGSAGLFPQSMSDLMAAAKVEKELNILDAQADNIDADTRLKIANSGLVGEQTAEQRLINKWYEPLKEAEYGQMISILKNDEVQRALARQNISESKAREALTIQQTAIAHTDAQWRDQMNRVEWRLHLAEIAESSARVEKCHAEINELYQRAIMESCQAGLYSQEELESLERAGLIEQERRGKEFENEQKAYNVRYKGLNYWLGVSRDVVGVATDVAGIALKGFAIKGLGSQFGQRSYTPPKGSSSTPFNVNYSRSNVRQFGSAGSFYNVSW